MKSENINNLFKQLVMIDSPSGEEQCVAQFIIAFLRKYGFYISQDSLGNILARKNGSGQPLLFCAHMDTVEPGRNIVPEQVGNRWQSQTETVLGADNKAAIAAILSGVSKHITQCDKSRSIELLFTVREETGDGLTNFDYSQIQAKHGIVFDLAEPLGKIVISSPHIINFTIDLTGKSGHVSERMNSRSVIPAMCEITQSISELDNNKIAFITIGQINAGKNINSIPGNATIRGEIRAFSHSKFKEIQSLIEYNTQKNTETYKIKSTLVWSGYSPGYEHDCNNPLVNMIKIILKANKLTPTLVNSLSVSDANILNQAGITTFVLSDGVANAHTTKESIQVADLVKMQQLVLSFLPQ